MDVMRRRKGSRANPRPTTLPGFSLTRLHSNAGWKWMFLKWMVATYDTDSGLEPTKYGGSYETGRRIFTTRQSGNHRRIVMALSTA
ncbi:unnamed protein product [Lasius platythorax]|uniref:Uncharacterized protein n=1 Tax=Lasius platythorax TaxID=488582 RepID=A0AAV2NJK2_9HYME